MSIFKITTKEEKPGKQEKVPTQGETKYQCPMKCEGEKTYDQPGRCPVCKMYLLPLK